MVKKRKSEIFNEAYIREAISQVRPKGTIKWIKRALDTINDDPFSSQLVLLESRLSKLKTDKERIKNESFDIEYSRINEAILELSIILRKFIKGEYSNDLIIQNSYNVNGLGNQIDEVKLEVLAAKENVKKEVQLNFYLRQKQINRLGSC